MNKQIQALMQLLKRKGKSIDPRTVEAALAILKGETKSEAPQGVSVVINLLVGGEERRRRAKPKNEEPRPSDDILAEVVEESKAKRFVDNIASAS